MHCTVVYQIVPGEEERRSVLGKRCRRFLTVANIEDLWIPQWRCQWILILIFYRLWWINFYMISKFGSSCRSPSCDYSYRHSHRRHRLWRHLRVLSEELFQIIDRYHWQSSTLRMYQIVHRTFSAFSSLWRTKESWNMRITRKIGEYCREFYRKLVSPVGIVITCVEVCISLLFISPEMLCVI